MLLYTTTQPDLRRLHLIGTTDLRLLPLGGNLQGRTPYNQLVSVPAHERLVGQTVDVAINHASPSNLRGEVVTTESVAKSA